MIDIGYIIATGGTFLIGVFAAKKKYSKFKDVAKELYELSKWASETLDDWNRAIKDNTLTKEEVEELKQDIQFMTEQFNRVKEAIKSLF